jgi:hypothetical protein
MARTLRQPALFGLAQGRAARDQGKGAAADARGRLLREGRAVALAHARAHPKGQCSADDVYRTLIQRGRDVSELGPAAGSLFDRSRWTVVHWTPSTRIQNHGRYIRVWRLLPSPPETP